MEKKLLVLFLGVFLVGCFFSIYNVYKLVAIDAKSRGMKHPKLVGLITSSGRNNNSLIAYLTIRKKYPVKNLSREDKRDLKSYKKSAYVSLGIFLVGIFRLIYVLVSNDFTF